MTSTASGFSASFPTLVGSPSFRDAVDRASAGQRAGGTSLATLVGSPSLRVATKHVAVGHGPVTTSLASLFREYVQPKSMFGTSLVDKGGLVDLVKIAGHGPVTTSLASLFREYVQPKSMFGTSLVDKGGLVDLVKIAGHGPVTTSLARVVRGYASTLSDLSHDKAALATLESLAQPVQTPSPALPVAEVDQDEIKSVGPLTSGVVERHNAPSSAATPATVSDAATVLGILAGLIMLSLLIAAWLHEANRVGPAFPEVNRLDLLQTGEWAVGRSLVVGLLVLTLLRQRGD